MKWPAPLARIITKLGLAEAPLPYEAPPGVGRVDVYVVALLVPVALLTGLVIGAPLMIPPGSTGDLTGVVGSVDNAAVWGHFPEPAQWIYHVGDIACHTKATRSFFLNGNQMPFCARDVAIFAGAALALGACVSPKWRTYRAVVVLPWWSYLVLLVPIAIDGGAQDFLGFESDNLRRVLTGFPAGLAVGFALAFIVYEAHFASARARKVRQARRRKAQGGGP